MNVLSQPKAGHRDVLTAEAGHPEGVISAHAGRLAGAVAGEDWTP